MTQPMVTHALARAVQSLADDNVPDDIQNLLMHGAPKLSIPPGALVRACLEFFNDAATQEPHR